MTWLALIPSVLGIIDKVIPDPQAAAEIKVRTLEMGQKGELAELDAHVRLALGQVEVNKVEAAAPDLFRGGWRPAVGWACVAGLIYQFLLQPILPWLVAVFGLAVPPLPPIDTEALLVLLTGMLGLGGMRTVERIKGKA